VVKNPALGNQRLDQHIHCQTHAHVVSHGERSPWVIRRSLPDAIRVPEGSERLSPVRSDGEGGLSKHGVQVGSPNARHVSIVPSRHRIPSFDVSKPTQLALKRDAQVRTFHSLHHLAPTLFFLVPGVAGFIQYAWHWEITLSTVCVTLRMPRVVTGGRSVSGEGGVSAGDPLHCIHFLRAPCACPFQFPPTMGLV
jgi:hypothetical protein